MIFKQVDEILSGRKTQTRRVAKPNHNWLAPSMEDIQQHNGRALRVWIETCDPPEFIAVHGRVVYEVGRTYAVQPGRGEPAVWWREVDGVRFQASPVRWEAPFTLDGDGYDDWDSAYPVNLRPGLMAHGWQPLRIRITAIRQEPLQSITEADAQAEGVGSVDDYRRLWESINKAKGTRWQDNPLVYVLSFEVVK